MAVKHAKLDSFLKRNLDEKVYDEVKICDPCIVVSKTEKKTFRFVFLTNQAICITDNPPKSILHSIPIKDLKNAQVIHDTATFLQKDLQSITQHLLIKHVTKADNPSPEQTPVKETSIFKTVFNSIKPKPQSNKSPGFTFTQSINLNSTDTIASVNKKNVPVINHNVGFESIGTMAKGLSGPPSFSKNYLRDSLEDSWSISGSSIGSVDMQTPSPRDLTKWKPCDPFEIEVTESLSVSGSPEILEVHLYILNNFSSFYMMLKVIWRSYLLNATWNLDPESSNISNSICSKDVMNALFSELKIDIITAFQQCGPIEDIYKYFHELKSVGDGSSFIKVAFWKDSDLLITCGNFLDKYSRVGDLSKETRSDELECMILVAQTLAVMLQDTEALMQCHKIMQKCSITFLSVVICALINEPSVADDIKDDDSVMFLIHDYAVATCDVIFELIRIAEQASWMCPDISRPNLTSPHLFSMMDKCNQLDLFAGHVMKDCVETWKSHSNHSKFLGSTPRSTDLTNNTFLSPRQVVKSFRNFTVLQRCLSKCDRMKKKAKRNFMEEFKYYIRPDGLNEKIPVAYPASIITRNIISATACCVFDEEGLQVTSGKVDTGKAKREE